MKITALCFFPKSIKENITMSRGTAVYSVKGIFLYSLWLCQTCPPLHGERSLSQAESPLFSRVEDKKRPCMSFAKSSNARSFCLCRRVSHFCPYQNKWQCPVTSVLIPTRSSMVVLMLCRKQYGLRLLLRLQYDVIHGLILRKEFEPSRKSFRQSL